MCIRDRTIADMVYSIVLPRPTSPMRCMGTPAKITDELSTKKVIRHKRSCQFFAPLLESILNAALEGEMDAHLTEEERQMGNRRNGKMQKLDVYKRQGQGTVRRHEQRYPPCHRRLPLLPQCRRQLPRGRHLAADGAFHLRQRTTMKGQTKKPWS